MRMLRKAVMSCIVTTAVAWGLSTGVFAVDGSIPINHGMALVGGVTPGDAAGYPVLITQPGLYRLTGSLTLPDANTGGIAIQSDDVTIDLNGFSIIGPTSCTGSGGTLSCAPTGSGAGITLSPFTGTRNRITIRNGRIKGAGGAGVDLNPGIAPGVNHVVEDLVVSHSGVGGLLAGGIRVGVNGTVRRCIVEKNAGSGILHPFSSGSVVENQVIGNLRDGLIASSGSTILRNLVVGNGRIGIDAQDGALVQDNTVQLNTVGGIDADAGSFVTRNTLRSNGFGIGLGLNAVASRNILTLTGGIGLAGGGVSALDNFCDGVGC